MGGEEGGGEREDGRVAEQKDGADAGEAERVWNQVTIADVVARTAAMAGSREGCKGEQEKEDDEVLHTVFYYTLLPSRKKLVYYVCVSKATYDLVSELRLIFS
jgi:hypothetical protein